MPPVRVIYRLLVVPACLFTTGTAICPLRAPNHGASKPMCPSQPIGTTLIICLFGVQTYRKHAHPMRTFIPRCVIRAPKVLLSAPTIPRLPNLVISGLTQNRVWTQHYAWLLVM